MLKGRPVFLAGALTPTRALLMRTPRGATLRLLRTLMIGSLVVPSALFGYAAWNNFRTTVRLADERINRSLDVLHEHALKVFKRAKLRLTRTRNRVTQSRMTHRNLCWLSALRSPTAGEAYLLLIKPEGRC